MNFLSVFVLDGGTIAVLIGHLSVREVEVVLALALVHTTPQSHPLIGTHCNTRARFKQLRGAKHVQRTKSHVAQHACGCRIVIKYKTFGVYVCRVCFNLIISMSMNKIKIARGFRYCDYLGSYIQEL